MTAPCDMMQTEGIFRYLSTDTFEVDALAVFVFASVSVSVSVSESESTGLLRFAVF